MLSPISPAGKVTKWIGSYMLTEPLLCHDSPSQELLAFLVLSSWTLLRGGTSALDIWEVTLVAQTLSVYITNRMEYSKKMGLDGKLSNSFALFCLSYWCLGRVREACGDPQMVHNPTS